MLAAGGGTDNYYMSRLIQAQHIFNTTGVALFPWQVDDMPSDWMDAIIAYNVDVPKKAERINRVKNQHGKRN